MRWARSANCGAQYWQDVKVAGSADDLNQSLEKAGRVADFFELAELMCIDALDRNESCGGHFREEYQTVEGEAQRNDEDYSYVSAWEYGEGGERRSDERAARFRIRTSQPAELQIGETHSAHLATEKRDSAGEDGALRSAGE